MSRIIAGNRIFWPSSSTHHWIIRKKWTIDGYYSSDFDKLWESYKEESNNFSPISIGKYFDKMYELSCLKEFKVRLNWYNALFPASDYRRVSVDFDMRITDGQTIGAFVAESEPKTIYLTKATLLSIEDACQTLMSFWEKPLGIEFFLDKKNPRLSLRYAFKQSVDSFTKYPHIPETSILDEKIPRKIFENFLFISTNLSRQLFADHLSLMSLFWVIGHEDAHKYCGHLLHFKTLGISEQDLIFDELICGVDDKEYQKLRRAAELQADTCATMRAVDQCFDSEFLGIITQSFSVETKSIIWQGTKESKGLKSFQRNYLLRLICVSAFIPLSIFNISANLNAYTNPANYPSLITRVFNVIYTTFNRAIDCTIHHTEDGVGDIGREELYPFVLDAVTDFISVYKLISILMKGYDDESMNLLEIMSESIAMKITEIIFEYRDPKYDSELLEKFLGSREINFAPELFLVKEFIEEKHMMELSSVNAFSISKKQVNLSRLNKVNEDLQYSLKNIKIGNKVFRFNNSR